MSEATPPLASAIRKLRLGATFAESYGLVFSHLDLWLKAAAVPYLISMVLVVLSLMAQPNPGFDLLTTFLLFVPYTLFGVAWHRLTLLGPHVSPPRVAATWKRHHWRFLGYALAVTAIGGGLWIVGLWIVGVALLSLFLAIPLGESAMYARDPYLIIYMVFASEFPQLIIIIVVAAAIGALGFVYLLVRFSFVFPAVAVGEAYGLGHAWIHTRGQGFRLVGLMILTALPIMLVSWLLNMILRFFLFEDMNMLAMMGDLLEGTTMQDFIAENFVPLIILHGITNVFNYLLTAVMVSAISIAFRTCTGWGPAAGGAAPGSELKPG
jgi:hypothetical protein